MGRKRLTLDEQISRKKTELEILERKKEVEEIVHKIIELANDCTDKDVLMEVCKVFEDAAQEDAKEDANEDNE